MKRRSRILAFSLLLASAAGLAALSPLLEPSERFMPRPERTPSEPDDHRALPDEPLEMIMVKGLSLAEAA